MAVNQISGQAMSGIMHPPDISTYRNQMFETNEVDPSQSHTAVYDSDEETLYGLLDSASRRPNHRSMTDLTREEIDLKIENMQLRMDSRLTSMEGKMDTLSAQVIGSERAITLLAERAVAAAESAGNLKQTLWITSITTILSVLGIALATYFGTQASNIAIVQTTMSAFESGRAAGEKTPPPPPAAAPAQLPKPASPAQ